jgi:hypothetical protein
MSEIQFKFASGPIMFPLQPLVLFCGSIECLKSEEEMVTIIANLLTENKLDYTFDNNSASFRITNLHSTINLYYSINTENNSINKNIKIVEFCRYFRESTPGSYEMMEIFCKIKQLITTKINE